MLRRIFTPGVVHLAHFPGYHEADVDVTSTEHRVTHSGGLSGLQSQMFRKPGIWPLPPRLARVYEVSLKRAGVIRP